MPTKVRQSSPLTFSLFLFAFLLPLVAHATEPLATVPFVGCPADGQLGPTPAAKGKPKNLPIAPLVADKLAWYEYRDEGDQFGVLGPRGWNCFATIGSEGVSLYLAPEPLNSTKILEQKNWHGFTGPAIQFSVSLGGTSGRFEVAKEIARVFPAHRDFVRNVIAEGLEPASDFPIGPFPTDHLTYKSKELVEFTTPAHHKGLGTMSWLLPSDQPISGMALLSTGDDTNLLQLNVRLPLDLAALSAVIIEQAEREAAQRQP